uniref:Uncharacterized protein n=1 Tax=Schistocephalus solidus TaxID=70667 RepID=A0A0X3PGE1_SCHSO
MVCVIWAAVSLVCVCFEWLTDGLRVRLHWLLNVPSMALSLQEIRPRCDGSLMLAAVTVIVPLLAFIFRPTAFNLGQDPRSEAEVVLLESPVTALANKLWRKVLNSFQQDST